MRKHLRVALQLVLLLLVFAAGWLVHERLVGGGEESVQEAESIEPGQMAVPVRTALVAEGSLPRTLPFLGVLRASVGAERVLSSRCGGRVVAVHGTQGQRVEQGEPLLEFERTPLEAARAAADAEARAAELALDSFVEESARKTLELESACERTRGDALLASARVERLSALVTDGLAAPKALEEARNSAAQAQRELELAEQVRASWSQKGADLERASRTAALDVRRAAQHEAQALLDAAVLKAPADGQLISLGVRVGDRLESGAGVGVLLQLEGRVLVCGISPGELSLVHEGMQASWDEPNVGARSGRVAAVIGALDPATGTAELRIAPAGGPPEATGLAVRGEILLERLERALLVPEAALVRSQDRSSLVRIGSDALAHHVFVEVLARHGGMAAVEGKLASGDAVVVEGAYNLPEGARTVPQAPAPAGPTGGGK